MAESTVPNKVIKTKRLILREARQYDIGAMYALYSNKLVMQFWYVSFQASVHRQMILYSTFLVRNAGLLLSTPSRERKNISPP